MSIVTKMAEARASIHQCLQRKVSSFLHQIFKSPPNTQSLALVGLEVYIRWIHNRQKKKDLLPFKIKFLFNVNLIQCILLVYFKIRVLKNECNFKVQISLKDLTLASLF